MLLLFCFSSYSKWNYILSNTQKSIKISREKIFPAFVFHTSAAKLSSNYVYKGVCLPPCYAFCIIYSCQMFPICVCFVYIKDFVSLECSRSRLDTQKRFCINNKWNAEKKVKIDVLRSLGTTTFLALKAETSFRVSEIRRFPFLLNFCISVCFYFCFLSLLFFYPFTVRWMY